MERDFRLLHFFQDLVEVGTKVAVNMCVTCTVSLGEDSSVGSDQLWRLLPLQHQSPCRAACSAPSSEITHPIPELRRWGGRGAGMHSLPLTLLRRW